MGFLADQYEADPDTFLYDWCCDPSGKDSIMVKVYIDLSNYLSGKKNCLKTDF